MNKRSQKKVALAWLLRVGQRMSNLCFNLSQPSATIEARHREEMDGLRREWDKARTAYNEAAR